MAIMGRYVRTVFILLGLLFFTAWVSSQEESAWGNQDQTIPEVLRRPEMSEAPRYPKDVVIGELGQGKSPDEAYLFARNLLSALIAGNSSAPVLSASGAVITESLLEKIGEIEPRSYHLGGGRMEADGSVSFLVRLLGWEESIAGELYLRQEGKLSFDDDKGIEPAIQGQWLLDDLLLEEKQTLTDIRDGYRYDFTPYERFY